MLTTAAAPSSPNPKSNPNHPSKSGRRPLQPKNHHHDDVNNNKPCKPPKTGWIDQISLSTPDNHESNKENPHPWTTKKKSSQIETKTTLDASLAEELSAIREKLERMRLDKDETEKMLGERDLMLDMERNHLQERGQIQRMLEIEVDRLYRLNQLRSSCLISPIRSLRDKEQEKKIKEDNTPYAAKERQDRRRQR